MRTPKHTPKCTHTKLSNQKNEKAQQASEQAFRGHMTTAGGLQELFIDLLQQQTGSQHKRLLGVRSKGAEQLLNNRS